MPTVKASRIPRRRCLPLLLVAAGALGGLAASAPAALGAAPVPGQPGWFSLDQDVLSETVATGVNIANGNLLVSVADVPASDATYGVGLARFYNSSDSRPSPLGTGWSWDVGPQVRLSISGNDATLSGPTGYTTTLHKQPDGSFAADSEEFDGTLTAESGGSHLLARETVGDQYRFDASGALTERIDATGATHTVQQTSGNGQTLLGSFGTNSGRRVNVSYDGSPRVTRTDDPSSGHRYYGYDSAGRLSTFSDAAGGVATYSYGASGAMSALTLPGGVAQTFIYDPVGRVARTELVRPGQEDAVTTYTYESVDPDVCVGPGDAGQTVVNDGSISLTFCSNALGEVTDVVPPEYEGLDKVAAEAEAAAKVIAPDAFAGVWTTDDDHIKVTFTQNAAANLAAVQAQVSDPSKLVTSTSARTLQQLEDIDDDVQTAKGNASSGIAYSGVDTERNRVLIGATNPGSSAIQALKTEYGSALSVYADEVDAGSANATPYAAAAAAPSRTSERDPLVAGLLIKGDRPGSNEDIRCTSAFGFQAGDPPNSSFPQRYSGILTAGHCTIDLEQEWFQGGGKIGEVLQRNFSNGKRADAATINVTRTLPHVTPYRRVSNRVYLAKGRSIGITAVQGQNDDHVGDKVCFSGATTNQVRCGKIRINSAEIKIRDTANSISALKSQRLASFPCRPGDSGAPVFLGRQAIGIVSALSKHGCWFSHIGHAQEELGIFIQDYN